MISTSRFKVFTVILYGLLAIVPVMSSWDFALATKKQINFYDSDWKSIGESAHRFDNLWALAFDESDELIYFNDREHQGGSIFAMAAPKTLPTIGNGSLEAGDFINYEHMIKIFDNAAAEAIDFDPVDRNIYWSDQKSKKIMAASVDEMPTQRNRSKTRTVVEFKEGNQRGIAIDACQRKLYWTNYVFGASSINSVNLDGSDPKVLISNDVLYPMGIVVDHFTDRIYWLDCKHGSSFTVESARLDGSDPKRLYFGLGTHPLDLAVDKDSVYWSDYTQHAIWRFSKTGNATVENATKVLSIDIEPIGLIRRTNWLQQLSDNPNCRNSITKVKNYVATTARKTALRARPDNGTQCPLNNRELFCLNNGTYNTVIKKCLCDKNYSGDRCEISKCHNFCFHGACLFSAHGYPQCVCEKGYTGDRCEKDVCDGYCLNDGRCILERDDPVCECQKLFSGRRCEMRKSTEEICKSFCTDGIIFNELGWNMPEVCANCKAESANETAMPVENNERVLDEMAPLQDEQKSANFCGSSWNRSVILIVAGIIISLVLVFAILHAVHRIFKPLRPKIKKTYVVHKNVTPLTCRPNTEQCEIVIEDCCNMNICETPCFDPKLLKHSSNRENNIKEDKKTLINNIDLY